MPGESSPDDLLVKKDIAKMCKVSLRTINELDRTGKLPIADVTVTPRLKRWRRSTIETWITRNE